MQSSERKERIHTLLKGIETGDPAAVSVINPDKYIQHNPQTHEGRAGLAALFKRLSRTSPRVNIVRIFSDGDYVFAHTEYDFSTSRIGFEVFRFEGEYTVEHWDNIQSRQGPNLSGHSMVDGPIEAGDRAATESNREIVRSFVDEVLVKGQLERLGGYLADEGFIEHNPRMSDGLAALHSALSGPGTSEGIAIDYQRVHRVLADGSFVLSVSEGTLGGVHSSFYDLYRLAGGKIVEHWDTTETIPPVSEWKNDNGKF